MSSVSVTEIDKRNIMKKIEKQTEKQIDISLKSGIIANPLLKSTTPEKKKESCDIFQKIMNNGANEFKEKMGREMSYSEMREMYG
jgi:hypothetical protein